MLYLRREQEVQTSFRATEIRVILMLDSSRAGCGGDSGRGCDQLSVRDGEKAL